MSYREIRRAALEQGFAVERTKKGERFVPPDPSMKMVQAHATPSDRRALANLLAELRRAGLVWPSPAKKKTK